MEADMRRLCLAASAALALVLLAACNNNSGGGGGSLTLSDFTTGTTHSSIWGQFAVPFTGGSPTCNINTPTAFDPTGWWGLNPAITPSSDTVGVTVFGDAACSRAQQTLYRSAMTVDLSPFYSRLAVPAGSTTPQGGRINKATLQFNVVAVAAPSNPAGFACSPYIGGVGKVSVLVRNAFVDQAGTQIPIGARLIQASPANGPYDAPHVIGAFPAAGDLIVDLSLVGGPGSYGNGAATISDTGPGIHAVTADVTRWVVGAVNLNMSTIGFTVAGIGESAISAPGALSFACRSWVQPTGFTIKFL
jgi:hypothetical protein